MIFSANIGVRNLVGFFTCDVFCLTVTNSVEIFHSCEKFDGITHACYIWSDVKQATNFR